MTASTQLHYHEFIVCLFSGTLWAFGKATGPTSASSPDEIITKMFNINKRMTDTCLLSKQWSSGLEFQYIFLLVLEKAALRQPEVLKVL